MDFITVPTSATPLPLPEPSVDLERAARRSDDLPEDWTDADIATALLRYRRLLALVAEAPTRPIAPTRDIDFMWHRHMLHPRAYHADCMRLFGDILDHDGGFGKAPEELPVLMAVFEDTSRRYASAFGEPLSLTNDDATKCWHDCVGRCWHACSSKVEARVH